MHADESVGVQSLMRRDAAGANRAGYQRYPYILTFGFGSCDWPRLPPTRATRVRARMQARRNPKFFQLARVGDSGPSLIRSVGGDGGDGDDDGGTKTPSPPWEPCKGRGGAWIPSLGRPGAPCESARREMPKAVKFDPHGSRWLVGLPPRAPPPSHPPFAPLSHWCCVPSSCRSSSGRMTDTDKHDVMGPPPSPARPRLAPRLAAC